MPQLKAKWRVIDVPLYGSDRFNDSKNKQILIHTITQLLDLIYKNFEENKYTIGFFIDLSKAFRYCQS